MDSSNEFVNKVKDTQQKAEKNKQHSGNGVQSGKLPNKQHSTNK